jgi:hypothetical protein
MFYQGLVKKSHLNGESGEVRTIKVKQFQALRYENDVEICVVQGPITKPRNTADERIYRVKNNLIVRASHLNGE